MADKRAFAKFDVGYLDNPKMLDVLDASSTAILMHFASVLYCAQHLTDGLVASKAMQRKTGGTDADAQILIENGLWHTPGHDCESCPQPDAGKVYVHDFLEHNRDAAEAKRVSDKRRKAAQARWSPDAKSNAKCIANDGVDAMQREKEREKESSLSSDADAPDTGVEFPGHVIELCEYLAGKIRDNGNKVGTVGLRWHQAMDRLTRLDGYTPEQVRQVIDWCQRDEFWQGNILSAPKLREKFDQLKTRMVNHRPASAPPPKPTHLDPSNW